MENTQKQHKSLSTPEQPTPNIYTTTQNHNQTRNNTSDSITEVHFLGAPRKSVSFKCNEKLWKSFVSHIRAHGLSVCHILEAMIYGWLEGKVHLSNTIKPVRIENLVVERVVKRVRRYAVEVEDGVGRGFVCVLKDVVVPRESLPLVDCWGCPNRGCRERVLNG